MLKATISGAFSTGKTALVAGVAERLRVEGISVGRVPEVARMAPMPLHHDQTPDATAWLVGTQIALEGLAATDRPDLVLCDRAVFDFLSHALLIQPRSARERSILDAVWHTAAAWAPTYGMVIVTRIDHRIPPASDGFRVPDASYRERLQEALDEVFTRLKIDALQVPVEPAPSIETAATHLARRLDDQTP